MDVCPGAAVEEFVYMGLLPELLGRYPELPPVRPVLSGWGDVKVGPATLEFKGVVGEVV